MPEYKSFFLFGPRQVGKSSLIQGLWTDRVWNVDLLKNDQFLKYSKEPSLFRKEAQQKIKEGIKTIVIDEVQKLPALLDEVHSLIESSNTQFILTGSSARKLKRGGANLLAGRAVQRYLFPFTFNELREHFDLNHVLRLGSLPAIHELTDTESMDVLKTYTETYLKEEILSEGVARNIGSFSRFLDIAAAQCGEIVNYTNIGREAHVNARSVQSYYQILEDTLLGYFLHPWMKSVRKRLTVHPKFYFFDTGVTNAINHRLSAQLDSVIKGRLFEQWLILETHRMISYKNSEARMFYWRTNNDVEVDLLIEKHGKIRGAFEFKSSHNISGRDAAGLRSFSGERENKAVPLYIVGDIEDSYSMDSVNVISWKLYLENVLPEILK